MNKRINTYTRRSFFKTGALTFGALGGGFMSPLIRRALAGPLTPGKKVLFIFLRGGIDAIQAVIPYGDPGRPGEGIKDYLQARPNLGASPDDAHDLNGFVSLFPSMQGVEESDPRLLDIFNGGIDERGQNLAVLHRIGYQNQNRSHFSSQQFWENGVPGNVNLEEGIFNRYITAYQDIDKPIQAATINGNQMVIMKGQTVIPVLRSLEDYSLPGNAQLGTVATPGNPLGSGLKGAYSQLGYKTAVRYNALTYNTGSKLLDSLEFFQNNVLNVDYHPEPEAQPYYDAIADRGFASRILDCARLLKQVGDLQLVGCNQGNYDTHGGENRSFPNLVRDLSLAFTAFYHDLKSIWDDLVVVTLSEFGRTTDENANLGTDHGESTVCFAMGGPVEGGVYNADDSSWMPGDMYSSANGRYLAHRTDFRNMLWEILAKHLGDPSGHMDTIIPGFSQLVNDDTGSFFTPLNYIKGGS